jgi:hypothetical protein
MSLGKAREEVVTENTAALTQNVKRNLHLIGQAAWSRFRRSETPFRESVRLVFV